VKKTERKHQILQSAARLFSAKRFDEVLMDDIAQEAGVAKGTLYGYFPDKEELYFAVVFEGISDLNERLRARAEKDTAPEEKLRDMLHALVAFFKSNRFFFKLMNVEDSKSEKGRGENRRRWHEERRKQMQAIEAVLASGATAGVFEIRHLKIEASILRDMVRSALVNSDGNTSVDELVDVILRIFMNGVKTTPS
jgi:TetR/AcrR family transcriptional regulator, fatty acid metabolism regulator protein